MKKLLLLPFLLLFMNLAIAQSQFGIFAGAQTSTAKYSVADVNQPTSNKYGFQAGFGWKIPFEAPIYFSPAAFYSLKGYKVNFNKQAYPPDSLAINNNTTIQ